MWTSKIAIAFAFLAILSLSEAVSMKRENSLAPPFSEESESMMFWDMIGSAQSGGAFIRLTTDEEYKQGGIWNSLPTTSNNWEFQTQFNIHGKGVNLYGDGIAFWYVRDTLHQGPVFGSKDYFSGLGVFIDTFENIKEPHRQRHPYISAMVNNGSLHYENDEDGAWTQIGGCHASIRNIDVPTRIAISYIDAILAVYLDFEGFGQWTLCFKSIGVHLPTGYFFGITASTSDVSDTHDIVYVTSLNMDPEGHQWQDRRHIIPEAKTVFIPERYHKDHIEEEEQKVEEKREIKEDDEETEDVEAEKEVEVEKEAVHEKEAVPEKEAEAETSDRTSEEVVPPSTSLLRKLIYLTGAAIIIYIGISTYRKYSERRRERMQKRLF